MPAKKQTWKNSKAKAMLRKEIEAGNVDQNTDKDALHASHSEYKKWDKAQFKRNLKALIKAVLNPNKKNKVKWYKSEAKKLLREDIIANKVSVMTDPKVVYEMRPEYKDFDFEKFKTNLANLIEAVFRDYERMMTDCDAYGHDLCRLADLREGKVIKIPWHKSEAKPLLEKDMDVGKHLDMKPKDLYRSRLQYRAFSLEEFRKRIHQEKDKRAKEEHRINKKQKRTFKPPPDYEVSKMPKRPRPSDYFGDT